MKADEYVKLQIERARAQFRAAAFFHIHARSLRLGGKPCGQFLQELFRLGRKSMELVDAAAFVSGEEGEDTPNGWAVTESNLFSGQDNIRWVRGEMFFEWTDGILVSGNQYEYLKSRPLSSTQIFAEDESGPGKIRSLWRTMVRRAREARSDTAKEILYLTVGTLTWAAGNGRRQQIHRSPLFFLPVQEEATASGVARFRPLEKTFSQNSVLRRELFGKFGVSLYETVPERLTVSQLEEALAAMTTAVTVMPGHMTVDPGACYLTLLDSRNETVCQTIEKNFSKVASARLTRLFAGEMSPAPSVTPAADTAIYPLCADTSQKKVVEKVLAGESLYASAPAGTGKSQTGVNIAANLVLQGKSVCFISEKLAAGEVFLRYAQSVGLDGYCLSVNSGMRTSDIIKSIRNILSRPHTYLAPGAAAETVMRYKKAVQEYETLKKSLYREDEDGKMSVYDRIACSVMYPLLSHTDGLSVGSEEYEKAEELLTSLDTHLFSTMGDGEFDDRFFRLGTSRDEELDRLLCQDMTALLACGVDMERLIRQNRLTRENAVPAVLSAIARRCAEDKIQKLGLADAGNRRIRGIYKSLLSADADMRKLHQALLSQTLSLRGSEEEKETFLRQLDQIRVSQVTPRELFEQYGKEILAFCPIVVTTPGAAVSFLYDTGADRFSAMIADEASQMPIIALLPFLDRIDQLVVFGDEKQLGITSYFMKSDGADLGDDTEDASYQDRSVLEAAAGRLTRCELIYHYRSKTEMLIHVSNRTCYDGLLRVVPDVYTRREALPPHLGLYLIQVDDPEITPKGGNAGEARTIVHEVLTQLRENPDRSVGVIAFNEIQQALIWDMLEDALGAASNSPSLWVRTLENAQGKEADVVFISIGHSRRRKDGKIHRSISELNRAGGENRLNVLFTRAREKNVVVLSFDYRELKDADNPGIQRLYQYLSYAATGSLHESAGRRENERDTALVNAVSQNVNQALPDLCATGRIGSQGMTVDVALRRPEDSRYAVGLLMPDHGESAQEAVTKITVLERSGWTVTPVSPVYFLLSPERFASQIRKTVDLPVTFHTESNRLFQTARRPHKLFTAEDLFSAGEEKAVTPLSDDAFVAIDFERIYHPVLDGKLFEKDMPGLKALSDQGNQEASLLIAIRMRRHLIQGNSKKVLLGLANRIYFHDKKACYFLAQLLRTAGDADMVSRAAPLLEEAKKWGIGG